MIKNKKTKLVKKTNRNVFQDLGFDDAEAANFGARARLMILLEKELKRLKLTQTQAAKALGVKAPRISELLHGKIDKFSIDLLVIYLARLGKELDFKVKHAA